jgi:hypothetical protein
MPEADEEGHAVPRRARPVEQRLHLWPTHLVADHVGVARLRRLDVAVADPHQHDEDRERAGLRELRGKPVLEVGLHRRRASSSSPPPGGEGG